MNGRMESGRLVKLTVADEQDADGGVVLLDCDIQVFHDVGELRSGYILAVEVVATMALVCATALWDFIVSTHRT